MLVEFFGLPGAGKSMLSRHVAEILSQERHPVREITYEIDHSHGRPIRTLLKLTRLAGFVSKSPHRTFASLGRIAATKQATLSDLARAAFNWTFVAAISARAAEETITILDQGMAQAVWSVGFAAREDSWLDLLLGDGDGFEAVPAMVVHVRARLPTIRERLARRSPHVSRLEHILHHGDEPLVRAQAHCEAILDRLRERGITIVEIANDDIDALNSGARLVAMTITSLLHEPKGRLNHRSENARSQPICA